MIDIDTARQLALLSKIAFTDSELSKMASDMTDIVSLMDKIRDFVPDTRQTDQSLMPARDLRADSREASDLAEAIVSSANRVKDNGIVVPKVV